MPIFQNEQFVAAIEPALGLFRSASVTVPYVQLKFITTLSIDLFSSNFCLLSYYASIESSNSSRSYFQERLHLAVVPVNEKFLLSHGKKRHVALIGIFISHSTANQTKV